MGLFTYCCRRNFSFFFILSIFDKYFNFFVFWIFFIFSSFINWFIYFLILLVFLFSLLFLPIFISFPWKRSTLLPNDLLLDTSFLINSPSKLYSPGPGCFSLFFLIKLLIYTDFSLFTFCFSGNLICNNVLNLGSYLFFSLKYVPGPNIPFSVFKILYLGELLPKLSAVVKKFVCLGIISWL